MFMISVYPKYEEEKRQKKHSITQHIASYIKGFLCFAIDFTSSYLFEWISC